MSLHLNKELIRSGLKRSKALKQKGKLREALEALEKLSHLAGYTEKIVLSMISLNRKLAGNSKVSYLKQAKQILDSWKDSHRYTPKLVKSYVLLLISWSMIYQNQKSNNMALSCFMKALKILEKYPNSNLINLAAVVRCNISSVYIELKEHDLAIKFARSAISIIEKYKLKLHEIYLSAHYNIGLAQEATGDLNSMRKTYKYALTITKPHLSENSSIFQVVKNALIASSSLVNRKKKPKTEEKKSKSCKRMHIRSASEDRRDLVIEKEDIQNRRALSSLKLRRKSNLAPAKSKGLDYIHDRMHYLKQQESLKVKNLDILIKCYNKRSNSEIQKLFNNLHRDLKHRASLL